MPPGSAMPSKPSGDVDGVTEYVSVIYDDVSDIHSYSK